MAALSTGSLNLVDWAKRLDPNGTTANIAEMLAQANEILDDMVYIEGNLPTGHRVTQRTALPTPTWRSLNAGVTPTKSTTAQFDEQCGMLEAFSQVDVDLAKLNGNTAAFRLSEAYAHIEGMGQEMASTLFYGNAGTAPEEFTGLTPRYNSLSGTTGQNVINMGSGTDTDLTSVWLVGWSPQTVFGIYPKGSAAGLIHEDLGEQLVQTATGIGGGVLKAYVDHWQWKTGLVVRDWRYAVRICNVDNSETVADPTGATYNIINNMLKAIHRLPSTNGIRPAFYCNRTVAEMLDIQAQSKSNLLLSMGNEEGRLKTTFRGIPIRKCDCLEAETVVA